MLAALVNGIAVTDASHSLSIEDRGLSYGDGVFETMYLRNGAVSLLGKHLARLRLGCERLRIEAPDDRVLRTDIATLTKDANNGVVKLIVTRGAGGRGYRGATLSPTRVALLYPLPKETTGAGIAVRWCKTRLARNAQLAGIKHLNRLEQVLAQSEWTDEQIAEGLMLDTEGELICATASNLFIVSEGVLTTPDLRFSGIRGVMREHIITIARRGGIAVEEGALWSEDLLGASEVFVTNAVRGIRPVIALEERRWSIGPMTTSLMAAVKTESD